MGILWHIITSRAAVIANRREIEQARNLAPIQVFKKHNIILLLTFVIYCSRGYLFLISSFENRDHKVTRQVDWTFQGTKNKDNLSLLLKKQVCCQARIAYNAHPLGESPSSRKKEKN